MKIEEIDENISVEALIEQFPESAGYLTKEGVVCFVCGEPAWGTLGEIVLSKDLNVEKIVCGLKRFLSELKG